MVITEEARYRAECAWDSLPPNWQTEPVFVNHIAQAIQGAKGEAMSGWGPGHCQHGTPDGEGCNECFAPRVAKRWGGTYEDPRPELGVGNDPINHPSHYRQGSIECIDALREALGLEGFVSYCRGAIMKYAWRAGHKGPTAEDMRKAAWYATRVAEELGK